MCNLYNIRASRAEVAAHSSAPDERQRDLDKEYVSPGRPGWIVTASERKRELTAMTWGFPPPAGGQAPVVNVRNYSSPFWRAAFSSAERRCLVPATEFQEWSVEPDPLTGKKVKHWFDTPVRPMFAFAGVWRPRATDRRSRS